MTLTEVFVSLPEKIRLRLLAEYDGVVSAFQQCRWEASMLSAGKFCEVVYTILRGYPPEAYPNAVPTSYAKNFYDRCKDLERKTAHESIRLLIPRTLPAIYQIRNKRGVGHIGELVANHMDASLVLPACSWVMAELVRVFVEDGRVPNTSALTPESAKRLVEDVVRQPIHVVDEQGDIPRVLDITLNLADQIVLLAARGPVSAASLAQSTQHYTDRYMRQIIDELSRKRFIHWNDEQGIVSLTGKGVAKASQLMTEWRQKENQEL